MLPGRHVRLPRTVCNLDEAIPRCVAPELLHSLTVTVVLSQPELSFPNVGIDAIVLEFPRSMRGSPMLVGPDGEEMLVRDRGPQVARIRDGIQPGSEVKIGRCFGSSLLTCELFDPRGSGYGVGQQPLVV